MTRITSLLAAAFLLVVGNANYANAQTAADDAKQLFDGLCVRCHGINGTGDEAPSLNRATLRRAPDDQSLRRLIRDGIPEAGMPRVRRMTEDEVTLLVTYVRSLGRVAPERLTGNAERGRAAYASLGCASCHVIAGQGTSFGPELTAVGQSRSANYLRQAVVDPGAALPRSAQAVLALGFREFLPVSVVENNGREVRGARINEDSFTIQVRDASGQLHSFRKSNLERVEKQTNRSLMPSFKDRLGPAELEDLVAYLVSLGGAK
jgi:putative heme-binding domain-containing protein